MNALAASPAEVERKWRRESELGFMNGGWSEMSENVERKRMLQRVATCMWQRQRDKLEHAKTGVDLLALILTVSRTPHGLCLETPELPFLDGLLHQ